MDGITIKLHHDSRFEKKVKGKKAEPLYLVRIRVTYNRLQNFIGTGKYVSESDFKKMYNPAPHQKTDSDLVNLKKELDAKFNHATIIADSLKTFDFKDFRRHYDGVPDDPGIKLTLKRAYSNYRRGLDELRRVKTSRTYLCAINSLEEFRLGTLVEDVDGDFLSKYELWMREKLNTRTGIVGMSDSTIGIYVRTLRTILIKARADGHYPGEKYPFGRDKFLPPEGDAKKDPLSLSELTRLVAYKPDSAEKIWAKDMWMFCYYAGGLNPYDVLMIKHSNIENGRILIKRQKTRNTRKKQKTLDIRISPEMAAIIKRHGTDPAPNRHLFDVIKPGMDPIEINHARENFGRQCNKFLTEISEDLKISKPIQLRRARHTAANQALRSGAPKSFIRDMLNHASDKTTDIYLESMPQEEVDAGYTKYLTVSGSSN